MHVITSLSLRLPVHSFGVNKRITENQIRNNTYFLIINWTFQATKLFAKVVFYYCICRVSLHADKHLRQSDTNLFSEEE